MISDIPYNSKCVQFLYLEKVYDFKILFMHLVQMLNGAVFKLKSLETISRAKWFSLMSYGWMYIPSYYLIMKGDMCICI